MRNQKTSIRRRLLTLASVLGLTVPLSLGAAAAQPALAGPTAAATAQARVESWVTDLSTNQRLQQQPGLAWRRGPGSGATTVVVDPTRRYQRMTGFGASMTDTSAYLLSNKLTAATRRQAMNELFSRDGIGLSMLRQPMGASDFAVNGSYSYDDQPAGVTDPDLSDFSIAHDRDYIIPRLREARRLNPKLTMMSTPWSAPGWMKDTDSMVTGSLKPEFFRAYANYFVKYLKAYQKAGVRQQYVSPQNEPLFEPGDYPGMGMSAADEATFIGKYLGPALRRSGLDTKILAYDHNWDVPAYPGEIYHSRAAARYVPGTAWHCYGGNVVAQSTAHNDYPHAQAFMTECSGGTWQGTPQEAFAASMGLMIGVPRNWGQSVVFWNLALDQRNGPTNGGCQTCRGVVTVNDDGTVSKELEYWALGHTSKFVHPGAVRTASSSSADADLSNVTYTNRDGSQVMVAYNAGTAAQTFSVQVGRRHFTTTLAGGAAATYRWAGQVQRPVAASKLGWVDLDLGRGPAGTPTGRLTQSVSPELLDNLNQVRLADRWLAYSQPFGAQLKPDGPSVTVARTGWQFSASATDPASPLANLVDSDLTTRWSSGAGQEPGMWLSIDLGAERKFNQIVLDTGTSPGDYIRRYRVETSADGTTWTALARGQGSSGAMVIPLPPTTTRYLRLVSEDTSGSWWSVSELNLRNSTAATAPASQANHPKLKKDTAVLADGRQVTGVYNAGRRNATVVLPVAGFGYTYVLPPRAAVTFAVWSAG
ncbi:MAG: discoidin domain-containing protein [Propionibacteriaceae bacterium]